MSRSINNVPNDILRLIMKEASPNMESIQKNQLVCKRWYSIFRDFRFWRDLYQRDFQKEEDGNLSDLANYQLMYKIKWIANMSDTKNYIKGSELYPDRLVYGPIMTGYDGKIFININFLAQINNQIIPILTKVSGFKVNISNNYTRGRIYSDARNNVLEIEFDNEFFKSVITNITNYIIHNFDRIVNGKNGNFFYNGKQYSSLGDVSYNTPNKNTVCGDIRKKNKITFDNTFNVKLNEMGYADLVREYCPKCKEWHQYRAGYRNVFRDLCAFYQDKKKNRSQVKYAEFKKSIVVFSFTGFVYNPRTNQISINWKPIQLWLAN